jgi:ribosomal protein S18 acetylase RimI-like enzyme
MTRRQVVHLADSRLDEAARALALAFQDDPLQSYTFPDPEDRRRLSPAHFEAILRYGLLAGHVLTGIEEGAGAVVWMPPDVDYKPEYAEASGLTRLPEAIGADAAGRFGRLIDLAEAWHRRDMPGPHWYVMVVGVAPAFQGQGHGRALLQPTLDRADSDGLPCYLETTQPNNVSFYQRLGFQVLVDEVDEESGLRLWTFRRGPGER